MVNNSININKMNNHISPQVIEHKRRPQHMLIEIQIQIWDRHKNVAGLNRLIDYIFCTCMLCAVNFFHSCNDYDFYWFFTKLQVSELGSLSHIFFGLRLGLWCLTPLSKIFQLYRAIQFYWWRKLPCIWFVKLTSSTVFHMEIL